MPSRALPWSGEIRLDGPGAARVLLLAGFGSGPETLRDLGEHLWRTGGATVLLTGLAHHTGDETAFRRSRAWHYVREAERQFLAFWGEQRAPVHLGGYSTGALIALIVAARHPGKVAGLFLVSPALRLTATGQQFVGYTFGSLYYLLLPAGLLGSALALTWQARTRGWTRRSHLLGSLGSTAIFASAALTLRRITVPLTEGGPMIRDGEQVLPPHFKRASLVTGSTLVPLQLVARWRLARLSLPVCFVFGEADTVVDVRFGALRASATPGAELHIVPGAPHRVAVTGECHRVVSAFVARTGRDAGGRPSVPDAPLDGSGDASPDE